jgi:hypothetical protein
MRVYEAFFFESELFRGAGSYFYLNRAILENPIGFTPMVNEVFS